jgi:hypothetical protein
VAYRQGIGSVGYTVETQNGYLKSFSVSTDSKAGETANKLTEQVKGVLDALLAAEKKQQEREDAKDKERAEAAAARAKQATDDAWARFEAQRAALLADAFATVRAARALPGRGVADPLRLAVDRMDALLARLAALRRGDTAGARTLRADLAEARPALGELATSADPETRRFARDAGEHLDLAASYLEELLERTEAAERAKVPPDCTLVAAGDVGRVPITLTLYEVVQDECSDAIGLVPVDHAELLEVARVLDGANAGKPCACPIVPGAAPCVHRAGTAPGAAAPVPAPPPSPVAPPRR